MEKAIVTFNNPETNEFIKLNLDYNKDEGMLDYNIDFSEGYDKEKQMDFIGFLANMFLKSLESNNN